MDTYEIHDPQTGLKLLVEGDGLPSQQDAHELIQKEYSDLATNLHELPGGRFILNVGPHKAPSDFINAAAGKPEQESAAIAEADRQFPHKLTDIGFYRDGGGYAKWKQAASEFSTTNKPPQFLTVEQRIGTNMPPNSLVIMAHGIFGETNSFSTEWGHKFTLQNIASVLGKKTDSIEHILNSACYGGTCSPEDYSALFPNVKRISTHDRYIPNAYSVEDATKGNLIPKYQEDWINSGTPETGPMWNKFLKPEPGNWSPVE